VAAGRCYTAEVNGPTGSAVHTAYTVYYGLTPPTASLAAWVYVSARWLVRSLLIRPYTLLYIVRRPVLPASCRNISCLNTVHTHIIATYLQVHDHTLNIALHTCNTMQCPLYETTPKYCCLEMLQSKIPPPPPAK